MWNNGTVESRGKRKSSFDWFYSSWQWRKCKASYLEHVGGLCERCRQRGLIVPADDVHHKIRITAANINRPEITLNWANLEALCEDCHKKEHRKQRRWKVDADGNVILEDPPG